MTENRNITIDIRWPPLPVIVLLPAGRVIERPAGSRIRLRAPVLSWLEKHAGERGKHWDFTGVSGGKAAFRFLKWDIARWFLHVYSQPPSLLIDND